jgi:hypothetical protein
VNLCSQNVVDEAGIVRESRRRTSGAESRYRTTASEDVNVDISECVNSEL